MATSFKELFEKSLESPPNFGIVMKYNSLRVNNYQHLIFVEGKSDERFYCRTNNKILAENTCYIYQNYEDSDGGKEAVFFALNQIKNTPDLKSDLARCVFIVDRDWDLRIRSIHRWVTSKDENHISQTWGHSMESYFLEDSNITRIFTLLSLQEYEEDFRNKLQTFIKLTAEFWALKSTVVFANKTGVRLRYRKKYSFDEIFQFDFDSDSFFNVERMEEESKIMKDAIKPNVDLVRYYDIWEKKVSDSPQYMRGHNAFDFLFVYVNYVSKMHVSVGKMFDMVHELFVPIEIKGILP